MNKALVFTLLTLQLFHISIYGKSARNSDLRKELDSDIQKLINKVKLPDNFNELPYQEKIRFLKKHSNKKCINESITGAEIAYWLDGNITTEMKHLVTICAALTCLDNN